MPIEKLIDLVLQQFNGTDLIIAILGLLTGFILWRLIFSNPHERKKLLHQLIFWSMIVLVTGATILVYHRVVRAKESFASNETGILVLRITGDDDKNSLQHDLVDSLRRELEQVPSTNSIIVLASNERLDETTLNTTEAHERARNIGKQYKAQLVLWGDRVDRDKFWPFITIVNQKTNFFLRGERELDPQVIEAPQLPLVLVHEPVYLASFIAGLSLFQNGHYNEALKCLEPAGRFITTNSSERAPLLFYTALCHLTLAEAKSYPRDMLNNAIDELRSSANGIVNTNSSLDWVHIQYFLGYALQEQAKQYQGAEATRLLSEAAAAYRAALGGFTRLQYPREWWAAQNNLGTALLDQANQAQGTEKARLLNESLTAYRAALQVYTPSQFPQEWAMVQNNLAITLSEQAKQSQGAEATRLWGEAVIAIRAFTSDSYSRIRSPHEWAMAQHNLGFALGEEAKQSQGAEATRLLNESVAAYHAALEALSTTRTQFPNDWAFTQNNLGNALWQLAKQQSGSETARLFGEAAVAYRAALDVYKRYQLPQKWAMVQNNLGNVLILQARQSQRSENARLLNEAIIAFHAALEVYTAVQNPEDWANAQSSLGVVLADEATQSQPADAARLFGEAITAFRAALEIYTSEKSPDINKLITNNLARAQEELHRIQ